MANAGSKADAAHWRALFFQMLRKTGNVSAAARHAGRARAQLYRLRKQDAAFAAMWDDALEEAADWLELEALRRAMDGTEKQDKSASNADDERTISTYGVEATMGDWVLSFVQLGDETGDNNKSAGTEIEVAYDLSDKTVLNLVHLDSKQDKGANKGDKYKATQVGVGYEVAPGLTMGVAHVRFNATAVNGRADSDGNATRFQLRLNF